MIEKIEETHQYFLDGEELPAANVVARFAAREVYPEQPDEFKALTEAAMERGTKVHKATEELDKTGSCEIEQCLSGYVEAYKTFLREHEVQWELIEHIVYRTDGVTPYAGQIDRYGVVDGRKSLLDIKTTKKITKRGFLLYGAVQNLYKDALEHTENKMTEVIYILQLNEDGTYKLHRLNADSSVISFCCLLMHKEFEATKRKKKGKRTNG